jgi:transcriptional antiterminator NusG
MVETNNKKWYVVRAVSGQESKIKDYIMSEVTRKSLFSRLYNG